MLALCPEDLTSQFGQLTRARSAEPARGVGDHESRFGGLTRRQQRLREHADGGDVVRAVSDDLAQKLRCAFWRAGPRLEVGQRKRDTGHAAVSVQRLSKDPERIVRPAQFFEILRPCTHAFGRVCRVRGLN